MLESEENTSRNWWRRLRQRLANNQDMMYLGLFAFLLLCSSIMVSLVTVLLVQPSQATRKPLMLVGVPPAASNLVNVPAPPPPSLPETSIPTISPKQPLLSVPKSFEEYEENDSDRVGDSSGELFFATLNNIKEDANSSLEERRSPPALYPVEPELRDDSDDASSLHLESDQDGDNPATLIHINLNLLKRILQDNRKGLLPKVAAASSPSSSSSSSLTPRQNLLVDRGFSINGRLDFEKNNVVDTEEQNPDEPDLDDYIMILDPPQDESSSSSSNEQPQQRQQQHVFDVMHRVWANYELNTFEANSAASLTIFWAFDQSSVPDQTAYYAVMKNRHRETFKFVDISRKLTHYQRTQLIRNAIRDAMNEWSVSLHRLVVFREIPYKQTNLHKRVLIIGFRTQKHRDERTGESDTFGDTSTNTIAHAAFNVLHLNNLYEYQLMPRPITAEVPLILPYGPSEMDDAAIAAAAAATVTTEALSSASSSQQQQQQQQRRRAYHLYLATQQDFAKIYNISFARLYPRIRQPRTMTERINLAAVLIHELGHVLGLSHYLGTYQQLRFEPHLLDSYSIMAPVYNEKLAMLTALDKLAVNALFQTLRNEARAAQNQTL